MTVEAVLGLLVLSCHFAFVYYGVWVFRVLIVVMGSLTASVLFSYVQSGREHPPRVLDSEKVGQLSDGVGTGFVLFSNLTSALWFFSGPLFI